MGFLKKLKKIADKPISDTKKVVNKARTIDPLLNKAIGMDPLMSKVLGGQKKPPAGGTDASGAQNTMNQLATGSTLPIPANPVKAPNAGRLSAYQRNTTTAGTAGPLRTVAPRKK